MQSKTFPFRISHASTAIFFVNGDEQRGEGKIEENVQIRGRTNQKVAYTSRWGFSGGLLRRLVVALECSIKNGNTFPRVEREKIKATTWRRYYPGEKWRNLQHLRRIFYTRDSSASRRYKKSITRRRGRRKKEYPRRVLRTRNRIAGSFTLDVKVSTTPARHRIYSV